MKNKISAEVPEEVLDFLQERKGFRTLVHTPGEYQNYKVSKSSACWGNNKLETQNYLISVCQPTPIKKFAPIFFDFTNK